MLKNIDILEDYRDSSVNLVLVNGKLS